MFLGIDANSGLIYEGLAAPNIPTVPTPNIIQAKLIEAPADWSNLPGGLSMDPFAWIFREDSFDPVTRIRRGRLYEPLVGQSQPNEQRVQSHPYENFVNYQVGIGGQVLKWMNTFSECNSLLLMPNQGQGMALALGTSRGASSWRILQTEILANQCVMITLKSLSAFSILPAIDYVKISEIFRPAVQEAVERVLNSAFRESGVSVIDQCRASLTVLLSRWLIQHEHDDGKVIGEDLGALAKKIETCQLSCVAKASQIVARLHVRGKPNEQQSKGLRFPLESDAEFALHAVGLAIRDLGWAK